MRSILTQLNDASYLHACLIYGVGIKSGDLVKLRYRDFDLEAGCIYLRTSGKNREITLAPCLIKYVKTQLALVEQLFVNDSQDCLFAGVELPACFKGDIENAKRQLDWQFAFPSLKLRQLTHGTAYFRHHISEQSIRRSIARAMQKTSYSIFPNYSFLNH